MQTVLQKAWQSYREGRYDVARQELQALLRESPQQAEAHGLLALCLLGEKDVLGARRAAAGAIEHGPDSPFSFYVMGLVLYDDRRLAKAIENAEQAIRLDPREAHYYWLLGCCHFDLNQFDQAIEAAQQGLSVDPQDSACANLLGMARRAQGAAQRAAGDAMLESQPPQANASSMLATDPNQPIAHATNGWVALSERKPREAAAHFMEALRIDPNYAWAREGYTQVLKTQTGIFRWGYKLLGWADRHRNPFRFGILAMFIVISAVAYQVSVAKWPAWPIFIILGIVTAVVGFLLIMGPLAVLIIRQSEDGRTALSQRDYETSNYLVGFGVMLAIAGIGWVIFRNTYPTLVIAAAGMLALPISVVLAKPAGQRQGMLIFTAVMAALGVSLFLIARFNPQGWGEMSKLGGFLAAAYILGTAGCAWLPKDKGMGDR